ncbi:PH domain-like [Phytophthora cactorum]|nr:PH domain-like [Phytophthora cactorum]
MSYSYGGGGYGQGPSNFSGNVGAYAAQLQHGQHFGHHPTPLQALASAVALPDVFTEAEMARTLRRNNGDVMRAALQLKDKHTFRTEMHYQELNVGLPTLQEELRKGYVHLLDGAADSERCPVLLLQLQHFKPGFGDGQKLQRQGRGAADGSATVCIPHGSGRGAHGGAERPGIVFIVDVANCTLANLEAKMVTDILQVCKNWYPEVVKRILVVNSSAITKVLTMLLPSYLGPYPAENSSHGDPRELNMMLPLRPFLNKQAELEDVDLDAAYTVHDEEEEEDKGYGLKEREVDPNECLNGMQYANVSAVDAAEMPNSVLRGPLMRKKMDGVWAKHFALLRPEAVLLYDNATGIRPIIIIPVNYEVRVVAATFPDRPKGCGFRIEVPGVVGGHELVATSEQERGNWLQELQWAVNNNKEKLERREEREERRAKIHRDFDALNMINFDVDLPLPQPLKTDAGSSALMGAPMQVRPPQPVEMLGMSMPVPMAMNTNKMPNTMGMMQPMMQQPMAMQPQAMSMGMQSQQPMAGMASMRFGTQQSMSMGMQPMAYGMQQQAPMGVQPQGMMSMNMQPSMGMQQPMMMGTQQQRPMQMGMQQQPMQMPMGGQQGMNMPATSSYQLNAKSLQEQLLSSFRG